MTTPRHDQLHLRGQRRCLESSLKSLVRRQEAEAQHAQTVGGQAQLLFGLAGLLGRRGGDLIDPMGHHHGARHDPSEGLLVDHSGRGQGRHGALHCSKANACDGGGNPDPVHVCEGAIDHGRVDDLVQCDDRPRPAPAQAGQRRCHAGDGGGSAVEEGLELHVDHRSITAAGGQGCHREGGGPAAVAALHCHSIETGQCGLTLRCGSEHVHPHALAAERRRQPFCVAGNAARHGRRCGHGGIRRHEGHVDAPHAADRTG